MELKTFITQSLNQIIDGVADAQQYALQKSPNLGPVQIRGDKPGFAFTDTPGRMASIIEFDVAISVSANDLAEGGTGIFVGALGVGVKGTEEHKNSTINRIRFSVPVIISK